MIKRYSKPNEIGLVIDRKLVLENIKKELQNQIGVLSDEEIVIEDDKAVVTWTDTNDELCTRRVPDKYQKEVVSCITLLKSMEE